MADKIAGTLKFRHRTFTAKLLLHRQPMAFWIATSDTRSAWSTISMHFSGGSPKLRQATSGGAQVDDDVPFGITK